MSSKLAKDLYNKGKQSQVPFSKQPNTSNMKQTIKTALFTFEFDNQQMTITPNKGMRLVVRAFAKQTGLLFELLQQMSNMYEGEKSPFKQGIITEPKHKGLTEADCLTIQGNDNKKYTYWFPEYEWRNPCEELGNGQVVLTFADCE